MARGWKVWIYKVEELCYPCTESKDADKLRIYCEAGLRLCFRICIMLVFLCGGSFHESLQVYGHISCTHHIKLFVSVVYKTYILGNLGYLLLFWDEMNVRQTQCQSLCSITMTCRSFMSNLTVW